MDPENFVSRFFSGPTGGSNREGKVVLAEFLSEIFPSYIGDSQSCEPLLPFVCRMISLCVFGVGVLPKMLDLHLQVPQEHHIQRRHMMIESFPFGNPIEKVEQRDRGAKKAFILGVYASAVHAAWYSADGKLLVRALTVHSEPEIFWRGENAGEIVAGISIPSTVGYLTPAESKFNGPSGRTIDEHSSFHFILAEKMFGCATYSQRVE